MSIQFGKCNLDGNPVDPKDLDQARPILAPYGPDAENIFCSGNIAVIYRAFHVVQESKPEVQPHVSPSDAVITWDGRLDNRSDLVRELGGDLSQNSTDLSIVTGCYERWGTQSFAKLVGDWAVSIWNPTRQLLVLAKDFLGTRHLYYSVDKHQVTWSTILDALLVPGGKSFQLCEEYIAGWFSSFPAAHLTPYEGIHSVPPGSFVVLGPQERAIKRYWNFDADNSIQYRSDGEYEEHFRALFAQSVERRLRSRCPVMAELSGGMDSSSIVCMADAIMASGVRPTSRLDTISYYDNSEPNWDERPYFAKVEEMRGRPGCHIDLCPYPPLDCGSNDECFAVTPGSSVRPDRVAAEAAACMISRGNRAMLSGIGGDEFMGGVPTPVPELEDLLAKAHIRLLARQLRSWALYKRKPWLHLLFEAARGFFPSRLAGVPEYKQPPPWLLPSFVKRHRAALFGYENRLKLFGAKPSFQENTLTLEALRRQFGCSVLARDPPYEKRYPWLDRNLLEFVFAIPREQFVRPGQRRSLMRRALVGIVPKEILNRRRKAYVTRAPLATILGEWTGLMEIGKHMVSASLGIIDARVFCETLQTAQHQPNFPLLPLMRTLGVELWLRNLQHHGKVPGGSTSIVRQPSTEPAGGSQEAHLQGEFS